MKSGKFTYAIFALIGALIVFLGIKLHQSNVKFLETAQTTTAEIVDIDVEYDYEGESDYTVYVEFVVDNQKYDGTLNQYDSTMFVGKEVTVYYDPANPENFKGSATKFTGYLLIGFGAIFTLVGVIPMFTSSKSSIDE